MRLRLIREAKSVLVILGWGTSTSGLAVSLIFSGYLLPKNINGGGLYSGVINASLLPVWIFYIGNFAICILAAIVIADASRTILSFFPSYLVAAAITYMVLSLPDFLGCCSGVLEGAAVSFTLTAFFPYLFLVDFVGTLAGVAVNERFF